MVVKKLLESLTGGATPTDGRKDVAGFAVQDRNTGQTVHTECFDSSRYSDEWVANAIVKRREKLEKKYAPSRYEVEGGIFNSHEAFLHFFPEAGKKSDT